MTEERTRTTRRRWLRFAIPVGGLLAVVVAYVAYVQIFVRQEQGLSELFQGLEEQGYSANIGLSGIYRPGNVIQTAEMGPDGQERKIASPLLFLWGETCFPGLAPQESSFALAESAGTTSASLSLAPQALSELLPELRVQNTAVAEYSVRLENTRVLTYARAELSGKFAEACVRDWNRALRDGDESTWFAVIVEAVAADSLEVEMRWKSDSSLQARAALTKGAQEALAGALDAAGEGPEVNVEVGTDDEKTTVIAAKGLVILGYRARPMQLSATEAASPGDLRQAFEGSGTGEIAGRLAIRLQQGSVSRRVGVDHRFRTGDRFQFEITSSQPGWLFILHRPPGGETGVLWPPPGNQAPGGLTNEISRNQTYLVPPDPGAFVFDDEVGEESFFVAVQSNRHAPKTSGQSATVAALRSDNISVRGDIDKLVARGVTYDDGGANTDRYVYFAPTRAGDGTVAAIELKLRHEE